jgi:hypothetical protein
MTSTLGISLTDEGRREAIARLPAFVESRLDRPAKG